MRKNPDFLSKNPDFLSKNPDFLSKNPDFLLKNVDFIIIIKVVILAVSNLLQTYFEVFRDGQEDKLEMWALHFLLVVVVIDIANEDISLFLAIILSIIFMVLVARDWTTDKVRSKKGKQEWKKIKVLQVKGTLSLDNARGEKEAAVAVTNLTLEKKSKNNSKKKGNQKDDKKDEKKEMKFQNPIFGDGGGRTGDESDDSGDNSGDDSGEEATTPVAKGQSQFDIIKASTRMAGGGGFVASSSTGKPKDTDLE